MAKIALKAGLMFGPWTLRKRLGGGGNGEVYLADKETGENAALKVLCKSKPIAYRRFLDEVAVLKQNADLKGVVPIREAYLPAETTDDSPAWYTMPVGQALNGALAGVPPESKVEAIACVAEALATLHSRSISHRDIKPENLLIIDDVPCLADFGLVDYPGKAEVTQDGESIGPKWTMAPEMRRNGASADGQPADVYSLAKTLWIILTGDRKCFDGQFHRSGPNALTALFKRGAYITPLEELLETATHDDPTRRPPARVFAARLRRWLNIVGDWRQCNPLQWAEVQAAVFSGGLPSTAVWETLETILGVLQKLGAIDGLNHTFMPDSGGEDLVGAKMSSEAGCIELDFGNATIIRPKQLVFHGFPANPEWNYFRLETGGLAPTGIQEEYSFSFEEVTELAPGSYVERAVWEVGEYHGRALPNDARVVTRMFEGAFLICHKTSVYNRAAIGYDALHNKMSDEQFRTYIQEQVDKHMGHETDATGSR